MASYLVTGGAGFIGSHLTEELVRRGHRVRVADSLITGKRRNLAHIPGVDFLEGDLADVLVAQRATNTSARSPSRKSTPGMWARLRRFPVMRLSATRTRWPRRTSSSVRCDPMKPAPPVTR